MDLNLKGRIDAVTIPKFNSKQFVFIINVKVNDKWKYIWRRNENDANEVYHKILGLKNEQLANSDRKDTYLTKQHLRSCEIAVDKLCHHYGKEEVLERRLMIEAVELFIRQTPSLNAPYVSECIDKFLHQRNGLIGEITMRDYRYVLRKLALIYGERRINTINTADMREYLVKFENAKRKATHIYLKSFFEFCCGKHNPFSENGVGWMRNNPICWAVPKSEYNEPSVLSFNEIINVLLRTTSIANRMNGVKGNNKPYCRNRNELVAYYIFRLFSLMRKEEFIRLVEIGGSVIEENKYFDFERDRIILSTEIYRKKGRINRFGIGRQITPLSDTFLQWLDWMKQNKIKLKYPNGKYGELELREVCKEMKIKGLNVLRHTAITFHLLNFKESILTSKIGGTSLAMIERHYLSKNIPTIDAESFYKLTPTKAKELNIIN